VVHAYNSRSSGNGDRKTTGNYQETLSEKQTKSKKDWRLVEWFNR
jgi:hypothetical protein